MREKSKDEELKGKEENSGENAEKATRDEAMSVAIGKDNPKTTRVPRLFLRMPKGKEQLTRCTRFNVLANKEEVRSDTDCMTSIKERDQNNIPKWRISPWYKRFRLH